MSKNDTRKGDLAILLAAVLWGLFPVVTTITLFRVGPLTSLFYSVIFAAIFFGAWLTIKKQWRELLIKQFWIYMVPITIFNGILFYCLYFVGLRFTTPGNASLVALLETFSSYLFFNLWKKEYFSGRHLVGSVFMIAGAAIILIPKSESLKLGDWLVLAAIFVSPLGNYFQQKARKLVSSTSILFVRSLITIPVVGILALFFKENLFAINLYATWWFLLFNGLILLGATKILWIEGIHRIPVTKATALSSIEPLITLLFAYLLLKQNPSVGQLLAFIPMSIGLLLLTTERGFKFLKT